MCKRIVSMVAAFVLAVALLVNVLPSYAASSGGLSVSSETVSAGDEVTVTLNVPAIEKKLATVQFNISFDKRVFEVTEWNVPTFSGGEGQMSNTPSEANNAGMVTVTTTGAGGDSTVDFSSGATLTAKFKVKDGASLGKYTFDISTCILSYIPEDDWKEQDQTPTGMVKSATVEVVAAPVPATGITLDKTTLSLTTGDSDTLAATVAPADTTDTISWSSSDTGIATVDANGKITAVKAGTVTITAKAGNVTTSCKITVTCNHNLKDVAAQESTCTEKGWDAYKECTICGQKFTADGIEEISEVPFRGLKSHTGGTATCQQKAVCTVCGQSYGDYADPTYGDLIAEVPATHTSNGVKAHYECSVCGKDFVDMNGTELTSLAISNAPHGEAADTWTTDADSHWKLCKATGCDVVIDGTKASHSGGEATCVAAAKCEVCGVSYGTIDADNHVNTEVRGVEKATEENEGYTGDTYCLDCGEIVAEGTTIDKLVHNPVKVEAKEPTATEDGNIPYYYCENCDRCFEDEDGMKEITKEETVIEATGEVKNDDTSNTDENNTSDTQKDDSINSDQTNSVDGNDVLQKTDDGQQTNTSKTATDSSKNSTQKTSSPKTGDKNGYMLWIFAGAVAGVAVLSVSMSRGRRKH